MRLLPRAEVYSICVLCEHADRCLQSLDKSEVLEIKELAEILAKACHRNILLWTGPNWAGDD